MFDDTEAEVEMVDVCKQVLAVDSRRAISSFALSIMVSRHWGTDQKDGDTSLATIANTEKHMTAYMHPDHFAKFTAILKDHHDLIHSGFVAMAMAVTSMNTLLITGNKVGHHILDAVAYRANSTCCGLLPFRTNQCGTLRSNSRASTFSEVTKYARLLPETPMIDWTGRKGTYRIAPLYTLVVPTAYPEDVNLNTPEYSWGSRAYGGSALLALRVLQQPTLRSDAKCFCIRTVGLRPGVLTICL